MSRKITCMSLEGGCLFFEDGTEVSGISVDIIRESPRLLLACTAFFSAKDEDEKHHAMVRMEESIRKSKGGVA